MARAGAAEWWRQRRRTAPGPFSANWDFSGPSDIGPSKAKIFQTFIDDMFANRADQRFFRARYRTNMTYRFVLALIINSESNKFIQILYFN